MNRHLPESPDLNSYEKILFDEELTTHIKTSMSNHKCFFVMSTVLIVHIMNILHTSILSA
uniref:Uncharacterized protein n=1 Tax=Rhizophagus irregularis (strain DAOM 181602 / DAOM 197198 / MUCL 43194) TaxID=747089 RepID=U9UHS0_RHIID